MKNAYKILVKKPKMKRPLLIPRSWWEDNIRMDLWKNRLGSIGLDAYSRG
jgi:hypothetical protein